MSFKTLSPAEKPFITRRDVNCATTHNTRPTRGSRGSSRKRQIYSNPPCNEPDLEETRQVWIEAGFIPPPDCQQAVALLHRLAMDEEPATSLLSSVLTITAKTEEDDRGYRILNPARLQGMARDYGIEYNGRSDGEIARAVTVAIIGEYGARMPEERT
ncbi:MAG: hypothetical protein GX837_01235 [Methanomicrobiales archaeon]|nr:hypothetical protein [Methanomicrobiales archaeon]